MNATPTAPRHRAYGATIGRIVPFVPALIPMAILVGIVVELLISSKLTNFGWGFWGSIWDPPSQWGIAVFIAGSFLTALPALFFAMAIGLGIAIASTTYLPGWITRWLDPFVDLLAGIPSIVYGIWGYLLVAPFFGSVINPALYAHIGFIPGFGGLAPRADGLGLPVGVFILTLMALPITTLLIRDALRSVPRDLWEAGLGLGATRWETVRHVAIPYGSRGILSAAFLGFGRAFGETVAIAMVLNVVASYPTNVYGSTGTMAAEMFLSLDSAFGNTQWLAALSEMALVLLAISLAVNIIGRRLVARIVTYEVPGL
ncbi:MAG TPA: phosphate ABC transporter permease subunit PstC [Thermoplasmata archaeon]|nr:phosphate ABC transporter permease subunit PstC [Thermoplasmata archaeon]